MSGLPRVCERIVRWGLVGLLLFTPFAFGTVEPWSIALMEWGIVTLALVHLLGRLWNGRPARPQAAKAPRPAGVAALGWAFGLFVVYCALQAVPMPVAWLKVVAPASAAMYERPALELPPEAPPSVRESLPIDDPLLQPGNVARRPVSVVPGVTLERAGLVAVLLILSWLVISWGRSQDRLVFLLRAVTVVGSLVAFQGLVQFLTWNGRLLWFRKIPPATAFGPFVNHNHFAGYVEMVIPVAISLLFFLSDRRTGPRDDRDGGGRWGKVGLVLFATVVLTVTLLLSLSRGGILSTVVSGGVLFLIAWRRIPSRRLVGIVAAALVLCAAGLVAWIGTGPLRETFGAFSRVEKEASFRSRVLVWRTMVEKVPRFLWLGSGLGTFEDSFAPHAPPGSAKRWDKAHNDYLQLLWETGLVGTLLFMGGCAIYVVRFWWPALRGRGDPAGMFRTGIAVSLLSLALHSLVDFNLQIGANGFLFFLLGGTLVALQRVAEAARPAVAGRPAAPGAASSARPIS